MKQMGWQMEVEHKLLEPGDKIRFARLEPNGELDYAEGIFEVHSIDGNNVRFLGDIPAGIQAEDLMELVSGA